MVTGSTILKPSALIHMSHGSIAFPGYKPAQLGVDFSLTEESCCQNSILDGKKGMPREIPFARACQVISNRNSYLAAHIWSLQSNMLDS